MAASGTFGRFACVKAGLGTFFRVLPRQLSAIHEIPLYAMSPSCFIIEYIKPGFAIRLSNWIR